MLFRGAMYEWKLPEAASATVRQVSGGELFSSATYDANTPASGVSTRGRSEWDKI